MREAGCRKCCAFDDLRWMQSARSEAGRSADDAASRALLCYVVSMARQNSFSVCAAWRGDPSAPSLRPPVDAHPTVDVYF